jgi:DNA repair exonuclease SbcCD ATPase subunit
VAAFGATLEAALAPLLPFIAAMLAIQEATNLWETFAEKYKAAAEANAEACKKIEESTKDALKAVQELEEAMHPKEHNMAEKDEESLKQQKQQLENNFNRQRELNKVAEEQEMAGAGTSDQKKAVKTKYEMLGKQLDDWRAQQQAAIEGTMAASMEQQLKQLEAADDKLRQKAHAQYQWGIETGDMTRYNATKGDLEKNAGEAKVLREKLDELNGQTATDSGQAAFNSETNRQVFAAKGLPYGQRGLDITDFESSPAGQALLQLSQQTGKTNQQIVNIITGLLNHSLELSTVLNQLQSQADAQAAQTQNMRNSQGGQG